MRRHEPDVLTPDQLSALTRGAGAGAARASRTMAQMTGHPMTVTTHGVRHLRIAQVAELLGGAETRVVALHMLVRGDSRGNILMALSPGTAATLLAALLRRPVPPPDLMNLTRIEESGLLELGNTVAGSYLSALGEMAKRSFLPSIPEMAIDMAGAVVDDMLAGTLCGAGSARIIEMTIESEPAGCRAAILHLPEPGSIAGLVSNDRRAAYGV